MLHSVDKNGYDSIDSLFKRSVSPEMLHKSPNGKLDRGASIDQISEASYRQFLTAEQISKRQILRHQSVSPMNRKL